MTANDNGSVSNVSYGPANELLSINYYGATETRTYNSLLQLTHITTTGNGLTGVNLAYNFPTGSNNGKVSSITDALSGETVTYQYDSLNRLISAAGSGWTQTQTYDGFGNLTQRTGTGTASGTSMSTPVDAADQPAARLHLRRQRQPALHRLRLRRGEPHPVLERPRRHGRVFLRRPEQAHLAGQLLPGPELPAGHRRLRHRHPVRRRRPPGRHLHLRWRLDQQPEPGHAGRSPASRAGPTSAASWWARRRAASCWRRSRTG